MSNLKDAGAFEDTFFTISKPCEGLFKERNSKFYYFAFPVKSEDDIREHLAKLRKTYFDARHHCFAWVLGKDGDHFRSFDDGEPNHSAGDPILGQIRSKGLTNSLIVVVRYFGGTKLGMGGLIQAYKKAAALAIEESEIIEQQVKSEVEIRFPYASMNEVMKLVKSYELQILSQEMNLDCKMQMEFREGIKETVLTGLTDVKGLDLISS
jgi:uncharacterized YigZ family protein